MEEDSLKWLKIWEQISLVQLNQLSALQKCKTRRPGYCNIKKNNMRLKQQRIGGAQEQIYQTKTIRNWRTILNRSA